MSLFSTLQKSIVTLTVLSAAIPCCAAQFQKIASQFRENSPDVPLPVRQKAEVRPWTGNETGPVPSLQVFAREKSGALWLGSTNGAARFDPGTTNRWDRWQYFHGRRWLQDNDVRNIFVDESGAGAKVWIRTASGVSLIQWQPMTLEQKARIFDQRIESRHVRHGMVADCGLREPGNLASFVPSDSDNDGLWTAMYLGAECYRYAVTHDPAARAHARRAMQVIMRLESITGLPGFYARSFKHRSEPKPGGGEWHPTPDGEWLWKGDTSSDESVGHYYAYATYFDLVADNAEKAEVRKVVARITDYLIDHDYELIDLDGKPTRWGQWSESFFKTEEGRYEAALRSLQLLSFLKVAHHITGEPRFERAYQDRVARGYAEKMRAYRRWDGGGEINFSDDELAYLSYEPLLRYEKDARLRGIYRGGMRYTWTQIRSDRNPLWNYFTAGSGAIPMSADVRAESRATLERIPVDQIEWTVQNSHRLDVTFRADADRFGRKQLVEALPPDERPVARWNSNPYRPDGGGGGRGESDGVAFLLPYWYGRFHHWIK